MKCPSCGHTNINGTSECESCQQDLTSLDRVHKTKVGKILMSDPISKLSPNKPVVVQKQDLVLTAVKKMNGLKGGCVLVTDGDRLEGILTERDVVLKGLASGKDISKMTVESLMTSRPECLSAEDTLAYAVNRMAVGGYRHIPVLKDSKPVGIISIRDVLKYLSKLFS